MAFARESTNYEMEIKVPGLHSPGIRPSFCASPPPHPHLDCVEDHDLDLDEDGVDDDFLVFKWVGIK